MLTLHSEQSPLSASNISLTDDRDELGLLRTSLNWQISDHEIHTLRAYLRHATKVFAERGFARIDAPAGFYEDDSIVRSMSGDSNHHIGGTRMATTEKQGIVNTHLKIHGIGNGYICSCSVFPSSGFSNPTHTLLALAMRLTDHIVGKAAEIPTATVSGPIRQVTIPGTSKPVPQLAFGCSYLLGPGLDAAVSRRLLDAAYDAGVRHFDTARLYGQGRSEALLGDFLRDHPDATVTTKFGLIPPNLPQRVYAAAQRRLAILPNYQRKEKATLDTKSAAESLDLSLRLLGRDHIELFLLHEPTVADLAHDDLLAFLQAQRQAGKIGNFGIGGEYYRMAELLQFRPAYTPVLQFEASIFGPHLDLGDAYRIHYRTFATPAQALSRLFAADPDLARRWSTTVDADLAEPLVLSRLLLKASLDQHPGSLTLFSTRSEDHIFDNIRVATDPSLTAPAQRLIQLAHEENLSLEARLYPKPA